MNLVIKDNTKTLHGLQPTVDFSKPRYPLQIVAIPQTDRIHPSLICRLVHVESGLRLQGQFSLDEAAKIQESTRFLDFTLDKDRIPRCHKKLKALLENVCSQVGGVANAA